MLRGAGADVWFDPHVRDDAMPSGATIHEMRDRMVLVVVVSRAALASNWVHGELLVALKRRDDWLSRNTRTIERLRVMNPPYANFYEEYRKYFEWQFVPVVLEPIDVVDLQG